jgi:hypothetical protein
MNFALSFFISDVYTALLRLLTTMSSDTYLILFFVISISRVLLQSAFYVVSSFPAANGISSSPLFFFDEVDVIEVEKFGVYYNRDDNYDRKAKSVEGKNSFDMNLPLPPSHTNLLSSSIHFSMKIINAMYNLKNHSIREACIPLIKTALTLTTIRSEASDEPDNPYLPVFLLPFYSHALIPYVRAWFYSTSPDLRHFSLRFLLHHMFGLKNLPSSASLGSSYRNCALRFYSSAFVITMLCEFLKAYDTEIDSRNASLLSFMISSSIASLFDGSFSSPELSSNLMKVLEIYFEVISSPFRIVIPKNGDEGLANASKSEKKLIKGFAQGGNENDDEHERENILASANGSEEDGGKSEKVFAEEMADGCVMSDYYYRPSEYEEDMTDVWLRMKKEEKQRKEENEKRKKESGTTAAFDEDIEKSLDCEDGSMSSDSDSEDDDGSSEPRSFHSHSKRKSQKKNAEENKNLKKLRSAFPHLSSSVLEDYTSVPAVSASCFLATLFASPSDKQARESSFNKHPFGIEIRVFALGVCLFVIDFVYMNCSLFFSSGNN